MGGGVLVAFIAICVFKIVIWRTSGTFFMCQSASDSWGSSLHVTSLACLLLASQNCGVMRGEERFRAGVLRIRCHPILLFDLREKVASMCTLQPAHSSKCEMCCFIPCNSVFNNVLPSNFQRLFFAFVYMCVRACVFVPHYPCFLTFRHRASSV